MSDRFDPDAWPLPEEDNQAKKANAQRADDDYKSLDFDNPSGGNDRGGYGDPYSDAPYSDAGYKEDEFGFDRNRGDSYDYGNSADRRGDHNDHFVDNGRGGDPYAARDDDDWTQPAVVQRDQYDDRARDEYDDRDDYNDRDRDRDRYDDDYDDYDDRDRDRYDDYDGDYDNYDDFDDDKRENRGGLVRNLVLGLVVLLLLGGIIFAAASLFKGNHSDDAAQNTETTEATQAPDANQPTSGEAAEMPADLKATLGDAMTAWGQFATSGDLNKVTPYFTKDGSQMKKFESESADLKSSPAGAAMQMTPEVKSTTKTSNGDYVVSSLIKATRPNEQEQDFNVEMRFVRGAENKWQISTMRLLDK